MKKIGLACCALLLGAPAGATDWRIVSWNDEFVLYLDYGSIRHSTNGASYQSKVVYLKDSAVSELSSQVKVSCGRGRYRTTRISARLRSGKAETAKALTGWQKPQPGTNAEREFLIACTARTKQVEL